MRRKPTKRIEKHRITGPIHEANGAFSIPHPDGPINVIASDGSDWEEVGLQLPRWEHVSISLPVRTPTWEEMDFIKRIFWRDDELVIQMHVPRSQHINVHPYCLHLWKPTGVELPCPPLETLAPTLSQGETR